MNSDKVLEMVARAKREKDWDLINKLEADVKELKAKLESIIQNLTARKLIRNC